MLTIDRTLNGIWRVRKPRPIAQRVLVYWAAITLGPLVLGVSLSMTSWVLSANKGFVGAIPGGLKFVLDLIEFLLLGGAMSALYHYVPNTHVRWRHALAGGFFVAIGFELAKRGLTWYLGSVGTYSAIYGAFATVPIFLLWLFTSWVIVLMGAVIAAYAPALRMQVQNPGHAPGQTFALAIAVLQSLVDARLSAERGLSLEELGARQRHDPLLIEPVLESLISLDWVARLDEEGVQRHVLLCDPDQTPAAALIDGLLLGPVDAVVAFRACAGVDRLTLGDLLRPLPDRAQLI
jgi:membrane protein